MGSRLFKLEVHATLDDEVDPRAPCASICVCLRCLLRSRGKSRLVVYLDFCSTRAENKILAATSFVSERCPALKSYRMPLKLLLAAAAQYTELPTYPQLNSIAGCQKTQNTMYLKNPANPPTPLVFSSESRFGLATRRGRCSTTPPNESLPLLFHLRLGKFLRSGGSSRQLF